MKLRKLSLVALSGLCVTSLASCGGKDKGYVDDGKNYTYNTYTTLTPSNWNELTYQDNNDATLIGYMNSSFVTYDYKFDAEGKIVDGAFDIMYSAATKLEDVTSSYVGQYAVPAEATDSYAYKITLREDLKWDDGTPIDASDFIYTMQEQLNPLFKNYRADSYYNGALVLHNAKSYVFQGSTENVTARDFYSTWDEAKAAGDKVFFTLSSSSKVGSWVAGNYGSYLTSNTPAWVVAALGCEATQAELESLEGKTWNEISADETLHTIWTKALAFWQTDPNEELDFFAQEYTYPEVKWEEVGMFQGANKYELVLVLDTPLTLMDETGNLTYKAAYNFGGLPLVKKDLYEKCKQEPQEGTTLWTTNYNTSVETSASWGPYTLTYFQADKQYIFEKNVHWYGWNMEEYEGQYLTDKIVCDQVENWEAAWLLFQQGKVDSVSIDTTIADKYKYSGQAVFTPTDFVGSLQLQSSYEGLKGREKDGYNKTILAQVDFRKALSLGIDRTEYNNTCTTASKAGFGLFNQMHYYDVANGGVYRNEDVAKQVLCDVYGVNVNDYASLDEAYQAISGYNLTLARELVDKAVDAAIEAGDYTLGQKVKLTFGSGSITEAVTRRFEFIKNAWVKMVEGTKLEGLLELELNDYGTKWSNDFRAGAYDVCMGGWTGAAWDPGYFLLAYLSPDYMYSAAWDTSSVTMKFDINEDGSLSDDEEKSLMEWYDILNGAHETINWASGQVEEAKRLKLIAALEKEILTVYYTVPLQNEYSATLISYKWEYASRDYNTFMGYGGLRYITYNYTDEEWAAFCLEQNYNIDYTLAD